MLITSHTRFRSDSYELDQVTEVDLNISSQTASDNVNDDKPDPSALELAIEALILKIDKMEKDYKLLADQLAKQDNSNSEVDNTKAQMTKLKQTIKSDRQKTIRLVRKSVQENGIEV